MVTSKQVVFITGASSGIGFGLAQKYLFEGYKVVAFARRKDKLLELKNHSSEDNLLLIEGDVCSEKDLYDSVSLTLDTFGRVDCVIANAGVGFSTLGFNFDLNYFNQTVDVNLKGVARTYDAFLPYFLENKCGHFVTISSLAAYRGLPCNGAYSASKSGVSSFTESMRLDLLPYGIDVTLIHPGYIATPLTDRNEFYMPFLLTIEEGVPKIFYAIHSKKKLVSFPFIPALVVRMMRLIPISMYDFFLSGKRVLKRLSG